MVLDILIFLVREIHRDNYHSDQLAPLYQKPDL
jgi:hypothetical protein